MTLFESKMSLFNILYVHECGQWLRFFIDSLTGNILTEAVVLVLYLNFFNIEGVVLHRTFIVVCFFLCFEYFFHFVVLIVSNVAEMVFFIFSN